MKKLVDSDKRKHVVMVIPTLSTGGAEKFVCDMALNINRKKFVLSVIVLFSKIGNQKEAVLEQAGVSIYYLNKKPGLSLKCMWALKKLIKFLQPDIIHSHLDVLLYLLPSYKRYQVKLHTVHSMATFEACGVAKWIRKIAFKLFKVIPVAIGETVKKSISDYYKISMDKIPCIYNGVSKPNLILRNKHPGIIFINVGTLYYVKNQEMLLKAFKSCLNNTIDPIFLNIIGDGELRQDLEKQIFDLGLTQYVQLNGWTDMVYEELQNADVYVCSSIMEGVSLSIIEAMFCGLPIIATDVGGNKDLVKSNINGILVENQNEKALAEAMMKMINDENFRKSCAADSLKLSEQYTIFDCVRAYEALYLGE